MRRTGSGAPHSQNSMTSPSSRQLRRRGAIVEESTETAYGQFPIWHTDAEIRMLDLRTRTQVDMTALNSPDTESYHSWSSGSDWVVFSTRRDNGLYTLPYICAIDEAGQPAKPFLVPREDPDEYDYLLYSYNIPEFVTAPVSLDIHAVEQKAMKRDYKNVGYE